MFLNWNRLTIWTMTKMTLDTKKGPVLNTRYHSGNVTCGICRCNALMTWSTQTRRGAEVCICFAQLQEKIYWSIKWSNSVLNCHFQSNVGTASEAKELHRSFAFHIALQRCTSPFGILVMKKKKSYKRYIFHGISKLTCKQGTLN